MAKKYLSHKNYMCEKSVDSLIEGDAGRALHYVKNTFREEKASLEINLVIIPEIKNMP